MEHLGHQKWWCDVCDSRQVDSKDSTTGSYYQVAGMEHPARSKEEKWTSIIFAVCCECEPIKALHKIKVENQVVRKN